MGNAYAQLISTQNSHHTPPFSTACFVSKLHSSPHAVPRQIMLRMLYPARPPLGSTDEETTSRAKWINGARNPLQEDGTLYRLPLHSRLAYNKVGVATGITRAAIDHFMDLAMDKTPRGTAGKLRERVDAQLAVAEAEYLLETARSYVFDRVSDIWDTVDQGDPPTTRQKALLQLACSGAASTAVKAVEKIVAAAGATANFTSSPLERCMRDVLVVRQHIMVSPQFKENIGRALLGLESGTFLF